MSKARDGLQAYCRECRSARYFEANPLRGPMPCHVCGLIFTPKKRSRSTTCSQRCSERKSMLRLKYGISPDDYWAQLEKQELCCGICRGDWGDLGPQVDHDHATGALRGILCGGCNRGLGCFYDNAASVQAAATYLLRGGIWTEERSR